MSAGLANCRCGQPRLKPPLNPSAGQFAGFAVAAAFCAKPTEPVNTTAANAAPIPNAFSFMIGCSPVIAAWKDVIIARAASGYRLETPTSDSGNERGSVRDHSCASGYD